jgi:hypothetical protein
MVVLHTFAAPGSGDVANFAILDSRNKTLVRQ